MHTARSASDPEDDPEGVTQRGIIRVLGEGRCSVAAVPVLNPVDMCGAKYTPKYSRADGCTHTLHVEKYTVISIELRAAEPAEDALHPEKIHTAVVLYGEDSLLCYTFTTELQRIPRHCTAVLHYSFPLCPPPWPC